MRMVRVVAGVVVLACAGHAAAQSAVSICFDAGLVTLSARDASLETILAEWARVGDSRIVNAERIAGPPLTLELTAVRERDALGILLRSVNGYLAASRSDVVAGRSSIDRIIILPVSAPVREAPASASSPQPVPMFVYGEPLVGYTPDDLRRQGIDVEQVQRQLRARDAIERAVRGEAPDSRQDVDPTLSPRGLGPRSSPGPFGSVPSAARPGEILPVPQPDAASNPPGRGGAPGR